MIRKLLYVALPGAVLAGTLFTSAGAPVRGALQYLLGAPTRIHRTDESSYGPKQEEIFALKERIRTLEAERADLNALLAVGERKEKVVAAQIYAHIAREGERTLIIGKGKKHGIPRGTLVVSPAGVAVGTVERVDTTTSFVLLYKDARFMLTAAVAGEPDLFGLLSGGRGEGMRFGKVPAHKTLAVGSTVVTAGFESEVPPGIPVGTVAAVEHQEEAIFQEALISSPVEPRALRFVAVLIP